MPEPEPVPVPVSAPPEMRGGHGLRTTTLLVVTSMIGSGVFTTSGLLLTDMPPLAVLLVWVVGGLASLAGAWVYAELAVAIRESGGEYALVSRAIHPAAGFVVGLVTFVVGFCAPIAACAIAFARYASAALEPGLPDPNAPASWGETGLAALLIVGATLLHARERPASDPAFGESPEPTSTVRVSSASSAGVIAQDLLTIGKLALVLVFVVLGAVALGGLPAPGSALASASLDELRSASPAAMGLGVVLVSFAYSGWNAAAYFAGEVHAPVRTIPRALAWGTLLVTALYVLLNVVFLAAAPRDALAGQVVVGHIAAHALFGPWAARALSAVIAFGLLSTTSAFVWTAVRILDAMARHHARLAFLGRRPIALGLELVLSLGLLASASFDVLLGSVGFALSLASALTVFAVFRLPRKDAAYRAPLHPLPALFYLALMAATVGATLIERPELSLFGVIATLVGLVGYAVVIRKHQ